ncbi:hypothetical protein EHS25_006295 [Saitozyma podzolica]|uniref:Uncharacterized protein n=1 Tax=Saitozyma podzolica TaxID=1890683 RepID=A0A427YRG5_9TREE|nr:hypothetical protein EHS25_006295 [Saitozyma podzolica]
MPADTSTTFAPGLSLEEQSKIETALARTNDTVTFTRPGEEPLTLLSIFGPEPKSRTGFPSSRGYFEEDKTPTLWYKLSLAKRPVSTMSDLEIHWGTDTFAGDIRLTTRLEAEIKDDDRDKIDQSIKNTTARWFSGQTESSPESDWLNVSSLNVRDLDDLHPGIPRWDLIAELGEGTLQQESGPELKVKLCEEIHLELKNLRVAVFRPWTRQELGETLALIDGCEDRCAST